MAFVTPRMTLKVWNDASDPYDHAQLADNFLKLDLHDHSQGRGTLIGPAGIADGAIQSHHLSSSLNIGVQSVWHQLFERGALVSSAAGANSYPLTIGGSAVSVNVNYGHAFYLDPGNYPLATGQSVKVRVVGSVATNNTASPNVNFTIELRPATLSQQVNVAPTLTGGTVLASADLATPTVNTALYVPGGPVTLTSAGFYGLFLTTSAATAANSECVVRAAVQVKVE